MKIIFTAKICGNFAYYPSTEENCWKLPFAWVVKRNGVYMILGCNAFIIKDCIPDKFSKGFKSFDLALSYACTILDFVATLTEQEKRMYCMYDNHGKEYRLNSIHQFNDIHDKSKTEIVTSKKKHKRSKK